MSLKLLVKYFFCNNNETLPQIPLSILKKRTKIALIDDDDNVLPIEDLRNDGFTIEPYKYVDSNMLNRMKTGEFDIIILDIKGITKPGFIKEDGLGVLECVKKYRPAQIIIAFSNKKFDTSQQKFFILADDIMEKPITFIDCKEKLESIIEKNICFENLWSITTTLLKKEGVEEKQIYKIKKEVVKKIKGNKSLDAKSLISKLKIGTENLLILVELINNIIKLCKQQ